MANLCPSRKLWQFTAMNSERIATIIFAFFMTVLGTVMIISSLATCDREILKSIAVDAQGANCAEFWLYRYQSLVGGLCTLAGAVLASWFVSQQIKEARKQTTIMLGDMYPDFILRGQHRYFSSEAFELLIVNQNRRPVEINYVRVISHANIEAIIDNTGEVKVFGKDENGRSQIKVLIPGTRPAAEEAKQITLTGSFADIVESADKHMASVPNLVMEIGYEILDDTRLQRTATRSLSNAKIGGLSVKTEFEVSFERAVHDADEH
jgi:K+/H+ antiporter YhaU regulatory subunit KhtT